jgi:hypothetical protein
VLSRYAPAQLRIAAGELAYTHKQGSRNIPRSPASMAGMSLKVGKPQPASNVIPADALHHCLLSCARPVVIVS